MNEQGENRPLQRKVVRKDITRDDGLLETYVLYIEYHDLGQGPYLSVQHGHFRSDIPVRRGCESEAYAIHRPSGQRLGQSSGWALFGEMADEFIGLFPEHSDAIRLHGCYSIGPLYYFSNGVYHAGFSPAYPIHTDEHGKVVCYPRNMDLLKSHLVFGLLPDDKQWELYDAIIHGESAFRVYISGRLTALQAKFRAVIEGLGFTFYPECTAPEGK